jgi:hypothetical protein
VFKPYHTYPSSGKQILGKTKPHRGFAALPNLAGKGNAKTHKAGK